VLKSSLKDVIGQLLDFILCSMAMMCLMLHVKCIYSTRDMSFVVCDFVDLCVLWSNVKCYIHLLFFCILFFYLCLVHSFYCCFHRR